MRSASAAQAVMPRPGSRPSLLARLVGASTPYGMRRALWGYLFITPWLLGLIFFVAGPILASLALSFTSYDILSAPKFTGFQNYYHAFFKDVLFWPSLARTFYYAVVTVPLSLTGSLLLAILLNQRLKGTNIFRTCFFLPSLTPSVALAVVWLWLLQPKLGPVNTVLGLIGLGGYPWFTDGNTVIPSLIVVSLWAGMGGGPMLIFLAGLQGVPVELEDAARVDGAGAWRKFWNVTFPTITPTVFFNLTLGIIGALQVFTVAFVATTGGPNYGSWFFALHIYQQSFSYLQLGYGAALAWVFLVVIMILTGLNFLLARRWVFYRGAR
jgi:multiple sugar transport system permease protein